MRVLIAGGGLGGLCLAQGLLKAGHDVEVFERDADLTRKVGYRLHMSADGGEALRACLPDDLFELYLETSRETPPRQLAVVVDDQLNELSSMPHLGPPNPGPRPHTAVHRKTLRQILLGRIGDHVHLGRAATGYTELGDGVRLHLADGSSVDGDVLVGADGIHSPIRAQRLPEVEVIPGGIEGLGLYGRSALVPDLPEVLYDGFVIATNHRGGMMALGAYNPRTPVAEAAARIAPDIAIDPVEPYMMVSGSVASGFDETPAGMKAAMRAAAEGWHPALVGVVERIDADTLFAISFGRLDPAPPWEPSRVTLLGDAIHAMLPTLGQGANMALKDAAVLCAALNDDDPVAGHRGLRGGAARPRLPAHAHGLRPHQLRRRRTRPAGGVDAARTLGRQPARQRGDPLGRGAAGRRRRVGARAPGGPRSLGLLGAAGRVRRADHQHADHLAHDPGALKALGDVLLGPNADAAIIAEVLASGATGLPFRVDERVLKPRVAGFIAVGGSLTPQWKTLTLPVLHTFTFSMQTAVVDQVVFAGAGTPQSIVLDEAALERAAQLGRNVASQLGKPFEEAEYLGAPGTCPLCHLDVIVLEGPEVACATCGARGALVDGRVAFTEAGLRHSVIGLHEKREHFREIRETAAAHALRRDEIAARAQDLLTGT